MGFTGVDNGREDGKYYRVRAIKLIPKGSSRKNLPRIPSFHQSSNGVTLQGSTFLDPRGLWDAVGSNILVRGNS